MEKRVLETKRGRVYYWVSEGESKKNIMFTHGLTADHSLFNKQIDFWSKEYKVITWDMPLHGESKNYSDFSFHNTVEDIKGILDKESIEKVVMVGQSAGGYIAQQFIKEYDFRVSGFIGIDTSPLGLDYYKKSELFWVKNFDKVVRLYPYKYYCKVSAKAVSKTEEGRKVFFEGLMKLGKNHAIKAINLIYNEISNYEEVNIKCPVLLVLGELDDFGYVKKYNEMWHEKRGYNLQYISKAGHNSNYDNYEEFNKKTYDFLEKNS